MRKLSFAIGFVALVTAPILLVWQPFRSPPYRPNVILISIDTLAAKHLHTYGYEKHTAPFIEEWAKQNFVFENSYAASSYTATSHMSIFTGMHVSRHRFSRFFEGDTKPLDPAIPTLPQLMREAGYDTAWFGVMDDDHLDLKRGFERGFDFFSASFDTTEITAERLHWLKNETGRPKFVFMHSYMTHSPYTPRTETLGHFEPSNKDLPHADFHSFEAAAARERLKSPQPRDFADDLFFKQFNFDDARDRRRLQALYDEEILDMDSVFADTISALKKHGLYDNTVVILTSDHGEAFWEHGFNEHSTLHREILTVPLIVHLPGRAPGRSAAAVQGIDILPTLMEMIGGREVAVDGKSFWPILKSGADLKLRDRVFAQTDPSGPFSIQDAEWKLIEQPDGGVQLYRIGIDPFETDDVSKRDAGTVLNYQRRIREHLHDAG